MDEQGPAVGAPAGEVYVSGALTAVEDGAPIRLFYELLAEIVSAAGLRPYLPHRTTDPITAAHLDPRTVYDIDRAHVTGAAVLVGYAGIPSFGVGIEVELAREHGVPVILVVYLIGFGIPALDVDIEPVILGGIGLTLCYTAYVAEVYRAGLRSVNPTQREAALAVGLSERQALRHVLLPQAVRNVGPPLLNDFISLQKDVALIAVIGVTGEAFRQAQIATSTDFNYTPLLGAALLYLLVTVPLARLLDWWEARQGR